MRMQTNKLAKEGVKSVFLDSESGSKHRGISPYSAGFPVGMYIRLFLPGLFVTLSSSEETVPHGVPS